MKNVQERQEEFNCKEPKSLSAHNIISSSLSSPSAVVTCPTKQGADIVTFILRFIVLAENQTLAATRALDNQSDH